MIQKAIRRCDVPHAAYAAAELYPGYRKMLWSRLLTISAEDCYGIMTKEIVALMQADDRVNGKKTPEKSSLIFIAKAVLLLCMARKNRDADYIACNYLWGNPELTDEEKLEFLDATEVLNHMENEPIFRVPEYVFDVHTYKGKRRGKTRLDFFIEENEALQPKQMNLFDNGSFGEFYERCKATGWNPNPEYGKRWDNFMEGKETDPTHNGKNFPDIQ